MTFLAIIIAVLLLQVWGSAERVQFDDWVYRWQERVAAWGLSSVLSLVLLVGLPALLVVYVLETLESVLFGLLWLVLATVLLLYSFGRGDFQASMGRYRGHAFSGDFEAAYLAASEEFGWGEGDASPDSARDVHFMIQRALLYEGFQRWFAVLFYFVLLGPAGALAYRLLQLCRGAFEPALAERCLFLLDWVPARLLAATFSITGDFIGSREQLLAALGDTSAEAGPLLCSVGTAALGAEASSPSEEDAVFGPEAAAQNREFAALLSRSAVCWIVVLSLLVLLL